MSYKTQGQIAANQSMQVRVAQGYASEPNTDEDPDSWTWKNRRDWAAAPGWDAAWESYMASHPPVEGEPEPDPGNDEGVITDGMITSQIQSMLAAQNQGNSNQS